MKRSVCFLSSILLITMMSGCVQSDKPIQSATPALMPVSSPIPTDSIPTPIPSMNQGDLPAIVQTGLPTRKKMKDWMERYYYELDSIDVTDEALEKYNVDFDEETKADLDGDGKDDTIKLLPEKKKDADSEDDASNGDYLSMTVSINGKELKMEGEVGGAFDLSGLILDMDKSDGRKELLIRRNHGEGDVNYVITYDGDSLRIVYTLDDEWNDVIADGSGYMTLLDYDIVKYYALLHWKADGSGFEGVDTPYRYTDYLGYLIDKEDLAKTQWDQKLAAKPQGSETITVKQGTPVYFGLYDKSGWLEVLDANGYLLGWLNVYDTDKDDYTDHAYEEELP